MDNDLAGGFLGETGLLTVGLLGALPFIIVSGTAFVKIAVVLALLRNALGVQQIPPNIVIYSLALLLSFYVMVPVGEEIYLRVAATQSRGEEILPNLGTIAEPLAQFIAAHSEPAQVEFFERTIDQLWQGHETQLPPEVRSLIVHLPAFTTSELIRAFKIGFLLYLPFIAIDLFITNVLLSLGMMMLSPITISLPFKIFLLVIADGWDRLIQALVLSYSP